jgi:acyl carrier protein
MNPPMPAREQLRQRLLALTPGQLSALAQHLLPADEPDPRLYAWLVASDPGVGINPDQLRRQLAQRLPAYMLPAQFCIREALPRSSRGKLDRDALQPDPVAAAASEQDESPADGVPEDAVSDAVLTVWREVLGSARIDADDDFFELGGDSLLAMRVVSRLKRHFDTPLSPTDLFEHSSAATLAARLRQLGAHADSGSESGSEPGAGPGPGIRAGSGAAAPREQVEI